MALDRGTLAKIDRRVFAELDHGGGVQMVKVPVSQATWSTWRRYCEARGLSMGEGVAGLITHELQTVVGVGDGRAMPADRVDQPAEESVQHLDARERELERQGERLHAKEEHLTAWEQTRTQPGVCDRVQPTIPPVGRNDRCPCESGKKYKRCHGSPGSAR